MADIQQREERILSFWNDHGIFEKSVALRAGKDKKPFVFFEGPPTANGMPGIHHFIGRTFKDVVCRYQTMRGNYVLRKGGWDTHGLPVELQVEKELGFKSKKDIEAYGVAAYNKKCRESVWKYKTEWEQFTRRIGFWVDLDDPYVTYTNGYVESLWNIIQRVWEKGLMYQAHRVVPFCTRCGTPLSSHEVAQGYATVTDNSVYLKFKVTSPSIKGAGEKGAALKLPKNTNILAWTTTPWTLPGNVALAVGERIAYVLAHKNGSDEYFILAKDLANAVLGAPLAIDAEFSGAQLVGLSYEPLFRVAKLATSKSYKVYPADFVSTTDGTGVVHTAVMYGEDDYALGTAIGLPKVHTVDEAGLFIHVQKELLGKYVKSSDVEQWILGDLTERGRVLRVQPYEHEYPFCWRCNTPLLYYAKDSWFIRMSALRDKMVAANKRVNWVPAHLRDGRFGQWISEGKDWAFSRERYWGTPLPAWRCTKASCEHITMVGNLAELAEHAAPTRNTYWMLRHGEAESNVDHLLDAGEGKLALTDAGRAAVAESVRALKASLGRKKQKIDVIIASPILRTKETAEIAAAELGVKKVIYDDALREIQLGALQGCHDAAYHKQYPTYALKFRERPAGGESLRDLRARLWAALQGYETSYKGKRVLIVGHEYPLWMLAHAARGWDESRSIAEKESRGADFIALAGVEPLGLVTAPRDETGELDIHRPYIDQVEIRCEKCGGKAHRVPELCDVWFDSGAMPYAQWHWPFENEALFAEQYPADFIGEGIDQTRGWFYTLLAVATLLGKEPPYKTVFSYAHVLDEKGQKMSKSRGNIVSPQEVIDAVGVDAARWYFLTVNSPGDYKLFSMKEVRERLTGFMMTLENCLRFWELYANDADARMFDPAASNLHLLDAWVLSRFHGTARTVAERMDAFDSMAAARALEKFVVVDLSQWWLRRSRKRRSALGLLRYLLTETSKLLAPFTPFVAEDMYLRLHAGASPVPESVHLCDWPAVEAARIQEDLEERMAQVQDIITQGLAARKEEQIKVRQPLAAVTVPLAHPLDADLEELIRDELNVKEIRYEHGAAVALDTKLTPALRAEGFAREAMRQIQDMRKEAGYRLDDTVYARWHTDDAELSAALAEYAPHIARDTLLSHFELRKDMPETMFDVEKNVTLAPGKELWIGIRK